MGRIGVGRVVRQGVEKVGAEDFRPIPTGLLVPMNLFLVLVAIAALIGVRAA